MKGRFAQSYFLNYYYYIIKMIYSTINGHTFFFCSSAASTIIIYEFFFAFIFSELNNLVINFMNEAFLSSPYLYFYHPFITHICIINNKWLGRRDFDLLLFEYKSKGKRIVMTFRLYL